MAKQSAAQAQANPMRNIRRMDDDSFAVFDQPSQVYFPKTSRSTEDADKSQYADEDVEAVVGIFGASLNSL